MLVAETGIPPASFQGDLTDVNRMFPPLLFAMAVLSGALAPRTACGAWRSQAAPSQASEILAFLSEQPEPPEGGDQGDTLRREPNLPEANLNNPPAKPPSSTPLPPIFQPPDTSMHADSIRAFPSVGGAPLETIGPPTGGPFVSNAAGLRRAPVPRRGLLGIPPLALLAGLIALHICVVTRVVK